MKKHKKEFLAAKPAEAKDKGKTIAESLIPIAEKKAKQRMKKEKKEEKKENKQVEKRKTKFDNLDTSQRTEMRTRRRLTKDKPQVPVQTPPPIAKVEEKEEPQPVEPPPRKKLPAKR